VKAEAFTAVIDRRGWCFDRTAQATKKYSTQVDWDIICAIEPSGEQIKKTPPADLFRFLGLPLYGWCVRNVDIDTSRDPVYAVTVASFKDLTDWRPHFKFDSALYDRVGAVIYNDQRMKQAVENLIGSRNVQAIYSPDNVDTSIFHPGAGPRATGEKLRVGWAGSVEWWGNQKHVAEIQAASAIAQVEFVRQDREKDGLKDAREMAEWFCGLDLYVTLNDEKTCTPVTQLEAIACGVPTITTRCGELHKAIGDVMHWAVLDVPKPEKLLRAIQIAQGAGRREIACFGAELRRRLLSRIAWEHTGEADRVSELLRKVVEDVRRS
jgi:glycosyltransferase involved in cell wall biosynthesis